MKNDYHTVQAGVQSPVAVIRPRMVLPSRPMIIPAARPQRVALRQPFAGPVLVGDRETLRRLRAAEMAAWEAVRPKTTAKAEDVETKKPVPYAEERGRGISAENLLFIALSVAGIGAGLISIQDITALLTQWAEFVSGIGKLLS